MRLALNVGYWAAEADVAGGLELVREAERLGYASVWAAEAYSSDTATVLAWLAAQTTTIELGAAVFQIPARAPTMAAMTAATLDILSGGRFRLGLGVSGPQVSEGWYGVRFDHPLGRTREYVEVVRKALTRRDRVAYDGEHVTLPLPDGPGRALRLIVRPVRSEIPVYLASLGPRNLDLTGEIADGWLGLFASPENLADSLARIRAGRERAGRTMAGFDVLPALPLSVGGDGAADLAACADRVRPYTALYVGGMGSRDRNFYKDAAVRAGYAEEAQLVQDRYLARDYAGAAAAVPQAYLEQTALLGGEARIAERLQAYAAAGVTTLAVMPYGDDQDGRIEAVRVAAAALGRAGVGD